MNPQYFMNLRLSKTQLDAFSSLVGLAGTIVGAAVYFEMLPAKEGGFAAAVLGGILAWLTNKPASASPSTAQVERKNIEQGNQ